MLITFSLGMIWLKQLRILWAVRALGLSFKNWSVVCGCRRHHGGGIGCRRTVTNVWPGLVGESERLLTRDNQRNGCRGTSSHRKETHHHVLNTRLHASIVCRWHHSPAPKGFHREANFFSSSTSKMKKVAIRISKEELKAMRRRVYWYTGNCQLFGGRCCFGFRPHEGNNKFLRSTGN